MFANMTTGQLHRKLLTDLQKIYTPSEGSTIADWIFAKRLQYSKGDIIKNSKEPVKENYKDKIQSDLSRLLQHEPVQYILEEAWFYKMKLKVNPHVLIPRPETEELVELVIKQITDSKSHIAEIRPQTTIIDIGTGSGCIAIALKKNLPGSLVTAIDISDDALMVAKENALEQKVEIDFKRINFLNDTEWENLQQYHIIISNPPYIPVTEKESLDKNVATYEPALALFVPDDEPLLFYKKIALFGKNHLAQNGEIFVEVHETFAEKVFDLFSTIYFNVEIKKDIFGKNRIVTATQFL